jgi:hypothetical protein
MKRKRSVGMLILGLLVTGLAAAIAWGAYSSHQDDQDIGAFLQKYPFARSTKLDDCSLCHPGSPDNKSGSCDYCHVTYKLQPPHGAVPLNEYAKAYSNLGRSPQALQDIEGFDSDGDGYPNLVEIQALTFPGDPKDYPGLTAATAVSMNQEQIGKLPRHEEFLLMNASKSQDSYVQYAGATIKDILKRVRMAPEATQITIFAPDGFSKTFPIDVPDPQTSSNIAYDVNGPYPKGTYYGGLDFVDYPQWPMYLNGQKIPDELRLILAYERGGQPLTIGKLVPDPANPARLVLEGEGPYRLVNPQKIAGGPDRPSTAAPVGDGWDYDRNKDHNAGSSVRSLTAIRVEPLPPGTTDFKWTEGGWNLVDQGRIVIYGNIDPITYRIRGKVSDSNNGPVPGVQISFGLKSMGQVESVTSGADGAFETDLPMGQYIVAPMKQGCAFQPSTVEIDITHGANRMDFKAYPAQ